MTTTPHTGLSDEEMREILGPIVTWEGRGSEWVAIALSAMREVERRVASAREEVRVTDEMVERATAAYAMELAKRFPGDQGRCHTLYADMRAALEAALRKGGE